MKKDEVAPVLVLTRARLLGDVVAAAVAARALYGIVVSWGESHSRCVSRAHRLCDRR
eukprot:COSAG06_NODE_3381_length_5427_cov_3.749812_4_plen_57_part_00